MSDFSIINTYDTIEKDKGDNRMNGNKIAMIFGGTLLLSLMLSCAAFTQYGKLESSAGKYYQRGN